MVSIVPCLYMSEDNGLLGRDTRSSLFRISMVGVGVFMFVLNSMSSTRAAVFVYTGRIIHGDEKKVSTALQAERLVSRK
jgi:hypothetical protein